MENRFSFRKLQEKCQEMKLDPCSGSHVDRKFLLDLIRSSLKIKQHDPDLYTLIKPHVASIPDMRPQETLKHMATLDKEGVLRIEQPNNWALIVNELETLGQDEEINEFMDYINEENIEEIENYLIHDRQLVKNFLIFYPMLTWLLMKIGNENVIVPILISFWKSLRKPISEELEKGLFKTKFIPYIRDVKTARNFFRLYPSFINNLPLEDLIIRKSPEGWIYVYYSHFPVQFKENIKDILFWSLNSRYSEDVDFSLEKARDSLTMEDVLFILKKIYKYLRDNASSNKVNDFFRKNVNILFEKPLIQEYMKNYDPRFIRQLLIEFLRFSINNAAKIILNIGNMNPNVVLEYGDNEILKFVLKRDDIKPLCSHLDTRWYNKRDIEETREKIKILLEDGRILEKCDVQKLQKEAQRFVRLNEEFLLEIFLEYPFIDPYKILKIAIENDKKEIVKWLLSHPRIDRKENKYYEMACILLGKANKKMLKNKNLLMKEAISERLEPIVKILIRKGYIPTMDDLVLALDEPHQFIFPHLLKAAQLSSNDLLYLLRYSMKMEEPRQYVGEILIGISHVYREIIISILFDKRLKKTKFLREELAQEIGNNRSLYYILEILDKELLE